MPGMLGAMPSRGTLQRYVSAGLRMQFRLWLLREMQLMATRHVGRMEDDRSALCGAGTGRATRPKESVNCPDCRTILNHIRGTYPSHAEYTDWRPTTAQRRQAAQDFIADMHGGADD